MFSDCSSFKEATTDKPEQARQLIGDRQTRTKGQCGLIIMQIYSIWHRHIGLLCLTGNDEYA
jgi:hypothetical protein